MWIWAAASVSRTASTIITPSIRDFGGCAARGVAGRNLTIMVEPGRSIVGSAGVLLTSVLYRKHGSSKEFVIVDAAMNDLIRPALYQAHHEILPLTFAPPDAIVADVVGPVCESGDFLAHDRELPRCGSGRFPGSFFGWSVWLRSGI